MTKTMTSYLIRVENSSLEVTRVVLEQLEGTIEYEYPDAKTTDLLVQLDIERLDQLVSAISGISIVQGL